MMVDRSGKLKPSGSQRFLEEAERAVGDVVRVDPRQPHAPREGDDRLAEPRPEAIPGGVVLEAPKLFEQEGGGDPFLGHGRPW